MPWFQLFLFIHILTAIVAFGPTFAFPLIAAMGAKEPQHSNFATRVSEAIETRITIRAALTMPISGVAMILTAGIDWLQLWLILGVILYVAAVTFAVAIQTPAVERVIKLTQAAPMPAGPGAQVAGPPPELLAAVKQVQQGGMFLTVAIVAIVFLMVLRPTL
ncbi:MAG TPA: DUF2269 family protein [Candidatus Dormibacteraeota bacterium]|nr:DUF2269 family protein [Candidatus Dormibacteraeota bacterium]